MITTTNSTAENSYSARPPSFGGYVEQLSWWKRKMYSHIIGLDDELWDIIEDGVSFPLDSKGMVVDRKSLIDAHKKIIEFVVF